MISYVTELLQDAIDFSWPAAKGAHFVLVHRIADGQASYADLNSVHQVRERYTKNGNNSSQATDLRPVPCFKFNKNGCSESKDHPHNNLLLRHICQNCFFNHSQSENHSKKHCPRQQRNGQRHYQTQNQFASKNA